MVKVSKQKAIDWKTVNSEARKPYVDVPLVNTDKLLMMEPNLQSYGICCPGLAVSNLYYNWYPSWYSAYFFCALFPFFVWSLSYVLLFATLCTIASHAFLTFTISWNLLKLMSVESEMPSNHLILCCPLLLLPSIFPSIRVFSNESALHIRWPQYCSFCFRISPSNEYSGLISFRVDWFNLLAVQQTLKSLLQHHSLKASILQRSVFFMVLLSTSIHPYMTTKCHSSSVSFLPILSPITTTQIYKKYQSCYFQDTSDFDR